MISIRADATNILTNHALMAMQLVRGINEASERAKDILVASIREDLAKKILRPRESDGGLSDAIDGEIIRQEGDIIIGIGNKEKMDAKAPHWYLQDQGGPISVKAVPGYFVDMSGSRVIFDQGRAPKGPGSPGMDVFIWNKGAGSVMWIHNDVKPKHYFEAGNLDAQPKVFREFEAVLRRVFK